MTNKQDAWSIVTSLWKYIVPPICWIIIGMTMKEAKTDSDAKALIILFGMAIFFTYWSFT